MTIANLKWIITHCFCVQNVSWGRERNELCLVLYLCRLWLISRVVLLRCERENVEKQTDEHREVINQLCCERAPNMVGWGRGTAKNQSYAEGLALHQHDTYHENNIILQIGDWMDLKLSLFAVNIKSCPNWHPFLKWSHWYQTVNLHSFAKMHSKIWLAKCGKLGGEPPKLQYFPGNCLWVTFENFISVLFSFSEFWDLKNSIKFFTFPWQKYAFFP